MSERAVQPASERAQQGSARPRTLRDAALGYLERHLQTLLASLGRLSRAPFGTLLTVGVIGIALALPACLHVFVVNARSLSGNWEGSLDFTVYLQPSIPESEAKQIAARIGEREDVANARLVTAAQGLAQFRDWSGLGTAIDQLPDNPLPAAIVVRPRLPDGGEPDAAAVGALAEELRHLAGVDQVQLDTDWVRRFAALIDALRRVVVIASVVLACAVLLIVGNTIRLDIDTRRAEIEVTKLVGGSDGFVRRPFLYGGFWYGLGGGLIGWLLVLAIVAAVGDPLARIAAAYGSAFSLAGLDAAGAGLLLGGGALLGWLGAWVSATRHLRAIEPGTDG